MMGVNGGTSSNRFQRISFRTGAIACIATAFIQTAYDLDA